MNQMHAAFAALVVSFTLCTANNSVPSHPQTLLEDCVFLFPDQNDKEHLQASRPGEGSSHALSHS